MHTRVIKEKVSYARGALVAAAALAVTAAHGMELNFGNEDVTGSWNNTVRYNVGVRAQQRDPIIGNTANNDEGDYSFNRGQLVTNRLDLLSELKVDYAKQFGLRLSGAAWYDAAFHDDVRTNPNLAARGSYIGNEFSDTTKRYYKGPNGEILDAYLYANFSAGDKTGNVSAGQQTVLWGEAIFLSTHSVSYAQTPTDLRKSLATPGATARETALPIGQITGQLQVRPDLSVAGQYFYDWKETRFPEGGTYLAGTDFFLSGPNRFSPAPGVFLTNAGLVRPRRSGDWGVNARWRPEWLDGTLGVYAREFSERQPWLSTAVPGTYRFAYASSAQLLGLSLAKQVGGVSFGSELVYRRNTALVSTGTDANLQGARGDTLHALANGVMSFGQSKVWDSAILTAEVAYNHLHRVRLNEPLFNTCAHGDRDVSMGCATNNFWQFATSFSPTWAAVAPGLDIVGTFSLVNLGLKGNSAVLGGGNERNGTYGLAIAFDYNQVHNLRLAYNGYLSKYNTTNGTSISTSNGSQIQDRGWVSITYTANF